MQAQWVSVKERLPSEDGCYIVIAAGGRKDLEVSRYIGQEGYGWICEQRSNRPVLVTYWLDNLPLDPETGERFL